MYVVIAITNALHCLQGVMTARPEQPSAEEPERGAAERQDTADVEGLRPKHTRSMTGSDDEEVSDLESLDSVNTNDVDELLSCSLDKQDKDPEIILANRQCNVGVDVILTQEFGGEEPKPHLPGVASKLSTAVTSWLRVVPKREKIKEMFQNALIPDNIEGLLQVHINEILYKHLPFRARLNDQHLWGINTYFTRGIGPLVSVLDMVVRFESVLSGKKNSVQVDGSLITMNEVRFDITQVRELLSQAVKILSTGNSVVLHKCKGLLRQYLDRKYHGLLKPTNPITQDLLGPDLEQKISDSARVLDAGKKLAFTPRPHTQDHHRPPVSNASPHQFTRQTTFHGRGNRGHGGPDRQRFHQNYRPTPWGNKGNNQSRFGNKQNYVSSCGRRGSRGQNMRH